MTERQLKFLKLEPVRNFFNEFGLDYTSVELMIGMDKKSLECKFDLSNSELFGKPDRKIIFEYLIKLRKALDYTLDNLKELAKNKNNIVETMQKWIEWQNENPNIVSVITEVSLREAQSLEEEECVTKYGWIVNEIPNEEWLNQWNISRNTFY